MATAQLRPAFAAGTAQFRRAYISASIVTENFDTLLTAMEPIYFKDGILIFSRDYQLRSYDRDYQLRSYDRDYQLRSYDRDYQRRSYRLDLRTLTFFDHPGEPT